MRANALLAKGKRDNKGDRLLIPRSISGKAACPLSLIVPIIVHEDSGIIDSIQRAGSLFRQAWGENLVAYVGFGVLGILAMLPAIAAVGWGVSTMTAVGIVGILSGVLWGLLVVVVFGALGGIFKASLYRFAVDGKTPSTHFSADILAHAFVPRYAFAVTPGLE